MHVLIPMAGGGKRFADFGYKLPKPLIDVAGKPMIKAAIDSFGFCGDYIFVVREYDEQEHNEELHKVLEESVKNSHIISLPKLTRGAAETCLKAKDLIDNDDALVIINCDQVFNWSIDSFLKFAESTDADGIVATFHSIDPRYSFIRIDDQGIGVELTEKIPISDLALTGFHYWKHGSDFVRSAEAMMQANDKHNNEFYVAPTYNYLIKEGKKILSYPTQENEMFLVGTPEELQAYLLHVNQSDTV